MAKRTVGGKKVHYSQDCHAPWDETGKATHSVTVSRRVEVAEICLNCTEEKCRRVTGCDRYREEVRRIRGRDAGISRPPEAGDGASD